MDDGEKLDLKVDPAPGPGEALPVQETLNDYTSKSAKGRTLFIDWLGFKFGLDDKTLSIAFVLTGLLLIFIFIFGLLSIWFVAKAIATILDALIKALFMAIGVIVSRNAKDE